MNFEEKIQKLRKEKKLSQEQLAEKLNVSRQAVSKWESGQSYPEMEKLIEMTKIFECTLDDLTNEKNTIETINTAKQKNPINDLLNDITSLIDKSVNMFTDMKGEEIFKLALVMFLVGVAITFLRIPINEIYKLGANLFVNFGTVANNILSSFWYFILQTIYIIGGLYLFFYIYKSRYLDRYVPKEKIKNEPQDNGKKFCQNCGKEIDPKADACLSCGKYVNEPVKKETIVSEPPKVATKSWTVLKVLGKIVSFFVKLIAAFFSIPFIITFLSAIICMIIAIWFIIKGVISFGIIMLIISAIVLSEIIIELIFDLIFSRKVKSTKVLITIITGIILCGAGIGVTSLELTEYSYINKMPPQAQKLSIIKEFEMKDDLKIINYGYSDINYVVDKNIKNIKIEVNYYNESIKPLIYEDEALIRIDNEAEEIDFSMVNIIIDNLKNKKIYNYETYYNYEVKIYANEKNINKLKTNIDELYEEEEHYYSELNSCYENNSELHRELEDLQDKFYEKENEIDELQRELTDYKDKIKDLLD